MTRIQRTVLGAVLSIVFAAVPAVAASADTVLADNGFRPDPNGFAFENYGNDAGNQNLGPNEMRKLFGDPVCAELAGDTCTLTPEAKAWMDENNNGMGGGHCNGFAVLSELLFKGQFTPFSAGTPFTLQLQGNESLQRSLAYAFVFQGLDSVVNQRVKGTPNEILARLKTALNDKGPETFTLGIYKADDTGGHAITPFAVVDHGNGKQGVGVYDNNYPGQVREVLFDTTANTYTYNAAINPSVAPEDYVGTADHPGIELDPTTPGIGVQPCPFCKPGASPIVRPGDAPVPPPVPNEDRVQLDGSHFDHAHLLIRDSQGRSVGDENGNIVDQIPGSQVVPVLSDGPNDFTEKIEPVYHVPDRPAAIVVDGRNMHGPDIESVSSIGPGHDVMLSGLHMGPGKRDFLRFRGGVQQLSFTNGVGQHGSPTLQIGSDSSGADYAIRLQLVNMAPKSTVHVRLNAKNKTITFFSHYRLATNYVLATVRETTRATKVLAAVRVHLGRGKSVTYSYNTDHKTRGASGGGAG